MRRFVPLVAALMFAMLAAPALASVFEPCCAGGCEAEDGGDDADDCSDCSDCACCAGARAFPIASGVVLDGPASSIAGPFGAAAAPPVGEPREVLHVPKHA